MFTLMCRLLSYSRKGQLFGRVMVKNGRGVKTGVHYIASRHFFKDKSKHQQQDKQFYWSLASIIYHLFPPSSVRVFDTISVIH